MSEQMWNLSEYTETPKLLELKSTTTNESFPSLWETAEELASLSERANRRRVCRASCPGADSSRLVGEAADAGTQQRTHCPAGKK